MLILVLKNNILLSMLKTLPLLSGFFMNKMSNYISKKKCDNVQYLQPLFINLMHPRILLTPNW